MNTRTWSTYQLAGFDFVENADGNAIVEAVAGSGKSTFIEEAYKRVKAQNGNAIVLAFGKAIETAMTARGVYAKTFHGLCYRPVTQACKARNVETNKLRILVDENFGDQDARMYGAFASRLVGLARQVGIGCLVADTEEAFSDIIEHHDLELNHDAATMPRAIELSRKLLELVNASNLVDFDDLLYRAVKDGIRLPQFDVIFVDEAQDTNAIQRAIIRKMLKPGSRLIAVGDPGQAIYGFRGADSASLRMIAEEFNATTLPLSVSYRCQKAIVEHAKQWMPRIEAAPGAAEGEVEHRDSWKAEDFEAGDFVVCRTTAPLVSLAYRMIRARKPVSIMGREIGKGLVTLINKMNAKGIDRLVEKLNAFTQREVEKLIAKKQETKAEAVQDKTTCILVLIESLPETDATIPALIRVIEDLFTDTARGTVLSTIHKAKGLEADRVYWMIPARRMRAPTQEWQAEQERNLCYVAATRAKSHLVIIQE